MSAQQAVYQVIRDTIANHPRSLDANLAQIIAAGEWEAGDRP